MLLIRVASLGCELMNSGTAVCPFIDIFSQNVTAAWGLYPAIVIRINPI